MTVDMPTLDRAPKTASPRKTDEFRAADVFVLAVWFGCVGGVLEALSLLTAQSTGLMSWETRLISVDHNILWASPLVDLGILLLIALLLWLPVRLVPKFHWQKVLLVVFAAFTLFTSLSISGRIQLRGVIIFALGLGFVVSRWGSHTPEAQIAWFRRTLKGVCACASILALGSVLSGIIWERIQLARLPAPQSPHPSILFIVLDALRADRLGSYGYQRETTPFLDEFARRSVRFEKAIAPSSWTLPSHISMFTGRLPSEHGATLEPYDGRFPTLAEILASKGFATAGFVANSMLVTRVQGMARGFLRWESIFTGEVDTLRRTSVGRLVEQKLYARFDFPEHPPGRMDAVEVNRRFLRWLDTHPRRPFFAFLNFMELHEPYNPPLAYASRFLKDPQPKKLRRRTAIQKVDDEEARQIWDGGYDASLAFLDAQLRNLFTELERRALAENLIVVITSDHGQAILEHGLIGHRTSLYREQIHVPLLIALAGKTPQGYLVTDPVSLDALPATILGLAELNGSAFPAPSLVPLWSESPQQRTSWPVVAEVAGATRPPTPEEIRRNTPTAFGWVKSLVTPEWHFILQQNGRVELFSWKDDPAEMHSLAETPQGRLVVRELRRELERIVPEATQAKSANPNTSGGTNR